MNQAQKITLIGALVLIIAAFLPWIKPTVLFGEAAISQESIAVGWEGDGIITGGVGWILLLAAFFSKESQGKCILSRSQLQVCWRAVLYFRTFEGSPRSAPPQGFCLRLISGFT